jgi:hypothetical protein
MSDEEQNQENNNEGETVTMVKKEFHIKNTTTGDDLTFFGDDKDIAGMKELMQRAADIAHENEELKGREQTREKSAPSGGTTAPLNDGQIYGEVKSQKPNAEIQEIIDQAAIKEGVKEYDSLEEMLTDLNHRAGEDRQGDPTTNKILDELTFKAIKGHRQRGLIDVEIDPKTLSEQRKEQNKELSKIHIRKA